MVGVPAMFIVPLTTRRCEIAGIPEDARSVCGMYGCDAPAAYVYVQHLAGVGKTCVLCVPHAAERVAAGAVAPAD